MDGYARNGSARQLVGWQLMLTQGCCKEGAENDTDGPFGRVRSRLNTLDAIASDATVLSTSYECTFMNAALAGLWPLLLVAWLGCAACAAKTTRGKAQTVPYRPDYDVYHNVSRFKSHLLQLASANRCVGFASLNGKLR